MTTPNDTIPIDGYAVVWFGDKATNTPMVCKGADSGLKINGTSYAIYADAESATNEFLRWPHYRSAYGVLPVRLLVDEQTAYVLKDSAKKD